MDVIQRSFCDLLLELLSSQSVTSLKKLQLSPVSSWLPAIHDHMRPFTFKLDVFQEGCLLYIHEESGRHLAAGEIDDQYHRCTQVVITFYKRGALDVMHALPTLVPEREATRALSRAVHCCENAELQISRSRQPINDNFVPLMLNVLRMGTYSSVQMPKFDRNGDNFLREALKNVNLKRLELSGEWSSNLTEDIDKWIRAAVKIELISVESCGNLKISLHTFYVIFTKALQAKKEMTIIMPRGFDLNKLDDYMDHLRDREGHRYLGFSWKLSDDWGLSLASLNSNLAITVTRLHYAD
ncbi:hypothetical protein QR680_010873 [Steinernema hermaphroditum]|uniref:Uncharacterized protein n=1 Tax=Steinernema hermaphroditum TaxID=289476 RepID=A0AA39IQE3_9BILA|nr:hypothetical protein QR680_010873 [Steinernema hermaphroditum]